MPVVERPTFFGVELPFLDKKIIPDLSGGFVYRVRIWGLEGDEFTDRRLYQERYLIVRSENWVTYYSPGGPEGLRAILQREDINTADIELRAKKLKFIGKKIRWKE